MSENIMLNFINYYECFFFNIYFSTFIIKLCNDGSSKRLLSNNQRQVPAEQVGNLYLLIVSFMCRPFVLLAPRCSIERLVSLPFILSTAISTTPVANIVHHRDSIDVVVAVGSTDFRDDRNKQSSFRIPK